MSNPFQAPSTNSDTGGVPPKSDRSRGALYLILIPIAIIYTLAVREFAGPGYTTAPNQGAMVVFFLASVAWPIIAIVLVAVIRSIANIRGLPAAIWGILSWLASAVVPFVIGMK